MYVHSPKSQIKPITYPLAYAPHKTKKRLDTRVIESLPLFFREEIAEFGVTKSNSLSILIAQSATINCKVMQTYLIGTHLHHLIHFFSGPLEVALCTGLSDHRSRQSFLSIREEERDPLSDVGQRAVCFACSSRIRTGFVGGKGVVELDDCKRDEPYIFQGKLKRTSNEGNSGQERIKRGSGGDVNSIRYETTKPQIRPG